MQSDSQDSTVRRCISCTNVPVQLLEKIAAKKHFRKFGNIVRMLLRPKSKACVIEYESEEAANIAVAQAGQYDGQIFTVVKAIKSPKRRIKKDPDPDWLPSSEIQQELDAMGAVGKNVQYNLRPEGMVVDPVTPIPPKKKERKTKATWKLSNAKSSKPFVSSTGTGSAISSSVLPAEQMELLNILKQPSYTTEEKYRALEARDKLMRLRTKKFTDLKGASHTIGTCPDMCPEKERLMRVTQHQIAVYEQDQNGRMNPSLAIKQYSRSSADQEVPLPHELRPVSVLQLTMGYLMHKIIDLCDNPDTNLGEWYHFVWDRTRGIRKDITQQELCCQGSVQLVEQCARFHIYCSARLVAEEASVFDQKINTENLTKCLQTLKYMYHDLEVKNEVCRHEAEFRAYVILLNLNDGNFMWELQQLKPEIQKSPHVKFALDVYSALDKNNYVRFFKLVRSTTYLNACLLLRYFIQVRSRALRTILKSSAPRMPYTQFPVSELNSILAFEGTASTIDFFEYYGLCTNASKTHVIIDKKMFSMPTLPYSLDRAVRVIESKRTSSVGQVVCGESLPPKHFENYFPDTSFDADGYINVSKVFPGVDFSLADSDVLDRSTEKTDTFGQKKSNLNIFKNKHPAASDSRSNSPLFGFDTVDKAASSLKSDAVKPFWGKGEPPSNIFVAKPEPKPSPFRSTPTNSIFADAKLVGTRPTQIFGGFAPKSTDDIFGGFHKMQSPPGEFRFEVTKPQPEAPSPKTGGFTYKINITRANEVTFGQPSLLQSQAAKLKELEEENLRELRRLAEEKERKLEEEENERKRLRLLAEKIEAEEEEEKRKRELKIKKEKIKRELERLEEKRRLEEIRKKEEMKELRRIEKLKKQEEERKLAIQRQKELEEKIRRERLQKISDNIKNRKILNVIRVWHNNVITNKRKRKAIDHWPIWISSSTIKDEASQLHTDNQEQTLKYMKRYRRGVALDINIEKAEAVERLDVLQLVGRTLQQRYSNLDIRIQNNIFWKIDVSVSNIKTRKLEQTVADLFGWDDQNNSRTLERTLKITYCINKQRNDNATTDGFLFIGDTFDELFLKNVLDTVGSLDRNVCVPVVIILQNDCDSFVENDHISTIKIFSGTNLISSVREALVFLAENAPKPPPLELDTLKSFLYRNLATEIWQRMTSFTKWNHPYKSCLRNPKVVFNLYNEAIDRLIAIVLRDDNCEHREFFAEFLPVGKTTPDFLPCDYKYFPGFWKDRNYREIIKKVLEDSKLPPFETKWPPKDESDLEKIIYDFCATFFDHPENKFYVVMGSILKSFDPVLDFAKINRVLWSEVIETIAREKLNETDFSLPRVFATKTIFDQLFVVYDSNDLLKYSTETWFYLTNPNVKKEIDICERVREPKKRREFVFNMDYDIDLDKTLREVTNYCVASEDKVLKAKSDLRQFTVLMTDLEESMAIQRKISRKFDETLKLVIED